MQYTREQINQYLVGKRWYWYLVPLLIGFYIFLKLLDFSPDQPASILIMPAESLDFTLHELMHIFTAWLPSIITAASGSLSELLLGLGLIIGAVKTRCYFALMICCLWFMLASQSAGIYMADARSQKLNLVSLGAALSGSDKAQHDWNFVFGKLHILGLDTTIGFLVRAVGVLVGLFGIVFASWLLLKMTRTDDKAQPSEKEKELLGTTQSLTGAQPTANHVVPNSLYPTAVKGALREHPGDDKKII